MKRLLVLLPVVLLCAGFACDQKVQPGLMMRPAEQVLLSVAGAPVAQRPCANWAWAAALEYVLQQQDVRLGQEFWVVRAYGGAVCRSDTGSPAELVHVVSGEYTLDDGRKVRLEATHIAGAPRSVDDLILRLRSGQPFLLFWNSQAYLLHGVVYDEYIAPTGERLFQVRELKLLDLHPKARQRETSFDREKHDAAGIHGLMTVSVLPVPSTDWKRSR